jgi:hypothetical protein
MSIRPAIIDRCGERPCLPNFYEVAKRIADGREPSLRDRVTKALAKLRRRIAK